MTYRQDTHDLETVAFLIQHLFVIKLSLECLQIVLNYLSNAVCKLCAVGNLLPWRVVVCPDKNMCAAMLTAESSSSSMSVQLPPEPPGTRVLTGCSFKAHPFMQP